MSESKKHLGVIFKIINVLLLLLVYVLLNSKPFETFINDSFLYEYIVNSILFILFFALIWLSSYYDYWSKDPCKNIFNMLVGVVTLYFIYKYSLNFPDGYNSFLILIFISLGVVLGFNMSNLFENIPQKKWLKFLFYSVFFVSIGFLIYLIRTSTNDNIYNFISFIFGGILSASFSIFAKK
ncbi:hypothetical protein ABN335_15290 [Providencia rettgeri]